MVGVMTFDDIVDVIEQEAEEDIKALGGVRADRGAVRFRLAGDQGPLQLAADQSGYGVPRLLGAQAVRGRAAEDGCARRARADRRKPGRQCDHTDHDGGGSRARHARARRRQCAARHCARTDGRAAQRARLCGDHGRRGSGLVQGAGTRRGDRAGDGLQYGCCGRSAAF